MLTWALCAAAVVAVIDLTQETGEQQELNKAITASLQDAQGILGGQVTREEQDISRSVVGVFQTLCNCWRHKLSSKISPGL